MARYIKIQQDTYLIGNPPPNDRKPTQTPVRSGSVEQWRTTNTGLLLEVKDPEVLVTDALCEQTDTPKENRVHLVCDKNTDALCCERRQKPSL